MPLRRSQARPRRDAQTHHSHGRLLGSGAEPPARVYGACMRRLLPQLAVCNPLAGRSDSWPASGPDSRLARGEVLLGLPSAAFRTAPNRLLSLALARSCSPRQSFRRRRQARLPPCAHGKASRTGCRISIQMTKHPRITQVLFESSTVYL